MTTTVGLNIGVVFIKIPISRAVKYPNTAPIIPPKNVKIIASIKN